MKPLKIDDMIELLQKLREEHGNLRVVLVGEYRDISALYDADVTVGYDAWITAIWAIRKESMILF